MLLYGFVEVLLNNLIVGADGHCWELNFINWIVGFLYGDDYGIVVILLYKVPNHICTQAQTQHAEHQPQNPKKVNPGPACQSGCFFICLGVSD